MLYYLSFIYATEKVFISCDREYPPIRFEYKTTSEGNMVAEISTKQFKLNKVKKKNRKV